MKNRLKNIIPPILISSIFVLFVIKTSFLIELSNADSGENQDYVKALAKTTIQTSTSTSKCDKCGNTITTTVKISEIDCPTPDENFTCKPESKTEGPEIKGHASNCRNK